MAAEAQHASLRDRTSIVPRPPRVVSNITSMAHAAIRTRRQEESAEGTLALELFADLRRLPDSFLVHRATDNNNAPLILRDDVVVVDAGGASVTGGWYPVDGGLFLIEYCSPPTFCERYPRRSRSIVQTFIGHKGDWYAGGLRRGMQGRQLVCVDGPYRDEMALADKLIGKVVGILQPDMAVAS